MICSHLIEINKKMFVLMIELNASLNPGMIRLLDFC